MAFCDIIGTGRKLPFWKYKYELHSQCISEDISKHARLCFQIYQDVAITHGCMILSSHMAMFGAVLKPIQLTFLNCKYGLHSQYTSPDIGRDVRGPFDICKCMGLVNNNITRYVHAIECTDRYS
jgi:hypothetical protein